MVPLQKCRSPDVLPRDGYRDARLFRVSTRTEQKMCKWSPELQGHRNSPHDVEWNLLSVLQVRPDSHNWVERRTREIWWLHSVNWKTCTYIHPVPLVDFGALLPCSQKRTSGSHPVSQHRWACRIEHKRVLTISDYQTTGECLWKPRFAKLRQGA